MNIHQSPDLRILETKNFMYVLVNNCVVFHTLAMKALLRLKLMTPRTVGGGAGGNDVLCNSFMAKHSS